MTGESLTLSSDFSRSKLSQVFTVCILIFHFETSKFCFLCLSKSVLILEVLANLSSLHSRIICPERSGFPLPENTNFRPALYPNSVSLLFRLIHYDIVCHFTVESLNYQFVFVYTTISFKLKFCQYCHHLIAYYFLYYFLYNIFATCSSSTQNTIIS